VTLSEKMQERLTNYAMLCMHMFKKPIPICVFKDALLRICAQVLKGNPTCFPVTQLNCYHYSRYCMTGDKLFFRRMAVTWFIVGLLPTVHRCLKQWLGAYYICQHDLDTHCKAICDCLVQSANECIPGNSHHKRVAGWNESACLFKQQASFWHQLWVDCGYPSGGVVTAIRKKAKQLALQG